MTPPTPDATSPENLARIEKLAEAARAQRFELDEYSPADDGMYVRDADDFSSLVCQCHWNTDAAYIAAIPPAVTKALVAEIRRLGEENDELLCTLEDEEAAAWDSLTHTTFLQARVAELEKALKEIVDTNWRRYSAPVCTIQARAQAALSGAKGTGAGEGEEHDGRSA